MPINFPNTPATNDVYLAPNGIEYIYTGAKWTPFKPVEPTIGVITASSQLDLSAGGTNQNVVISPSGSGNIQLAGNVGIGTITPATKMEVSGDTSLACVFTATVTDTTLDVTAVSSGALAVGQYLGSANGRVRITALGTGTGGVGTYTIDTNQNGLTFNRSYVADPTTTRLGNSQASIFSNMPHGTLEFASGVSTAGPRAYIQAQVGPSTLPTQLATMLFGVGANNGAAPPRTALSLAATGSLFPSGISLGQPSLSPRNLNIAPATIVFGGRSQSIYTSGASLSSLNFSTSYIDASVETTAAYGQIGYVVDSSITSGQLPANFYIQTRNSGGVLAERFRITATGDVGIGTTLPTEKLEVAGNIQAIVNGGASSVLAVSGTSTDYSFLRLRQTATESRIESAAVGTGTASPITFFAGASERLRIALAGQLGIGGENYGTSGQVLTSGGPSAAPSWTTLSSAAPTTAQVGTATAGLAVGDVGSYALLWHNTTAAETPGTTVAGSTLRYASTTTDATNPLVGYGPTAPAGTWRCMGHTAVQGGGTAYAFTISNVTVWLRIS
jgi:hypothetical protein